MCRVSPGLVPRLLGRSSAIWCRRSGRGCSTSTASSPELEDSLWCSWLAGIWAGGARRAAGRLLEGFHASGGHSSLVSTTVQSISLAGEPEKRAGTGRHRVEGRVQDGGCRAQWRAFFGDRHRAHSWSLYEETPSHMYAAALNRFHGCHVMWALGVSRTSCRRHSDAVLVPGIGGL